MIGLLNKDNIWLQNVPEDSRDLFDTELYNFGIVYNNNGFLKPKLDRDKYIEGATADEIEAYEDSFYPEKVTALQFKMQALIECLNDDIDNAINNLPEPNKSVALLKYENATEFVRKDVLVITIGQMIGLSKQEINEFFLNASKFE